MKKSSFFGQKRPILGVIGAVFTSFWGPKSDFPAGFTRGGGSKTLKLGVQKVTLGRPVALFGVQKVTLGRPARPPPPQTRGPKPPIRGVKHPPRGGYPPKKRGPYNTCVFYKFRGGPPLLEIPNLGEFRNRGARG